MSRRHAVMLVALALIWGASFLLIKIGDRELDPVTVVAGRTWFGALALAVVALAVLGRGRAVAELRGFARPLVITALLNTALPFWLLAWGETRIETGLAAIIQAAVPIFIAVIAFAFFPDERIGGLRLTGVLLGFVGVAVLVGIQPRGQLLGALAVVGMAIFYAIGGLLAGRDLKHAHPTVVALGTTLVAALVTTGPAIARAPQELPGWKPVAAVAVLGVVGTGIAYLLFFAIIQGAGASSAGLVTYLVPPIALAYGALFLDESIGVAALVGLTLILVGVALGTRSQRSTVAGDVITIRPAREDDLDFLVELVNDDDVQPFLAGGRRRDREELAAELERMAADPVAYGRMVIEVDGERAGAMGWERVNERSRIAHLGGLAVHGRWRGRGVADKAARLLQRHLIHELGYHRLQLEVYGFNERAIAHAERAGFVREGVKRRAYWRDGEWVDGVLFGLVAEDLA